MSQNAFDWYVSGYTSAESHFSLAEGKNLLNVTALEVVQLQFPVGRTAGFLGGVGGVVLPTQGRGVR